jgi:hypothetical protein
MPKRFTKVKSVSFSRRSEIEKKNILTPQKVDTLNEILQNFNFLVSMYEVTYTAAKDTRSSKQIINDDWDELCYFVESVQDKQIKKALKKKLKKIKSH